MSGSLRASNIALISCFVLSGSATLAQANPSWVDPPTSSDDIAPSEPTAPLRAEPRSGTGLMSERRTRKEQAARDLAYEYLNLWSAPNRVTLASASSFYGSMVTFMAAPEPSALYLPRSVGLRNAGLIGPIVTDRRQRKWRARPTERVAQSGPASTSRRATAAMATAPSGSENTSWW